MVDWSGLYPAVTTQFHRDESLDIEATQGCIDRLIEAGVQGLVMLGTVGENGSLDAAEKRRVLRAAVEARPRVASRSWRASPRPGQLWARPSPGTPRRSASTA